MSYNNDIEEIFLLLSTILSFSFNIGLIQLSINVNTSIFIQSMYSYSFFNIYILVNFITIVVHLLIINPHYHLLNQMIKNAKLYIHMFEIIFNHYLNLIVPKYVSRYFHRITTSFFSSFRKIHLNY